MDIVELKDKLKSYSNRNIIVTDHASIRADFRKVTIEEVKNNITNPEKLVYFREVEAKFSNERKFECYFAYNDNLCHKYALTVNGKVIIVTIIFINRKWQRYIRR